MLMINNEQYQVTTPPPTITMVTLWPMTITTPPPTFMRTSPRPRGRGQVSNIHSRNDITTNDAAHYTIQAPSLGHTPCHTPVTRPRPSPRPSVPGTAGRTRSWCWIMSPPPSQTQNLQTKQRRKNPKRLWRRGERELYAWWVLQLN